MHKNKLNTVFLLRIEISFIITLTLLILLFYFYPRFETLFKTSSENLTPDFVIMAIPRTIQKLEMAPARPILPGIPIESDRLDISSEVEIPEESAQKSADSVLVF